MTLAAHHAEFLEARAVSGAVVAERGYRTVVAPAELVAAGYGRSQSRAVPGLLIPRWSLAGRPATAHQFRPDRPRTCADGHQPKYETPANSSLGVDCLPSSLGALRAGSECWVSAEGHIKADAMRSAGVEAAVAVVGVWSWHSPPAMPTWEALAASSPGRWFHVVCDNDFVSSSDVPLAVCRLGLHLKQLGGRVRILHPPPGPGKVGVDDWLAAGGALDGLVQVDASIVAEVLLRRPARARRAYSLALESEAS